MSHLGQKGELAAVVVEVDDVEGEPSVDDRSGPFVSGTLPLPVVPRCR